MKELYSKGLTRFDFKSSKIIFFVQNEDILLDILSIIFPLFVNTSLSSNIENLLPSLVPLSKIPSAQINKVKRALDNHHVTSGYVPKCGYGIGKRHNRFIISHLNTKMVVKFFWNMISCIEFKFVNNTTFECENSILSKDKIV